MSQEEIFQILGKAALKSVANISEWKEVILYIERQEKSIGFKSSYISVDDQEIRVDTEADYFTSKAVKNLYDLTSKHPMKHKNWNKAKFIVDLENQFHIEYIWDQDWENEINSFS
ncbi:hypothetical protein AB9P05_00595 [Roseivirga sp. BDSF3-8]|uniref:hypothetical protein n=1 Tax=Roseivirga sp. BDSF3-8 TaxID=3241598 RepID=UPI003531E9DE